MCSRPCCWPRPPCTARRCVRWPCSPAIGPRDGPGGSMAACGQGLAGAGRGTASERVPATRAGPWPDDLNLPGFRGQRRKQRRRQREWPRPLGSAVAAALPPQRGRPRWRRHPHLQLGAWSATLHTSPLQALRSAAGPAAGDCAPIAPSAETSLVRQTPPPPSAGPRAAAGSRACAWPRRRGRRHHRWQPGPALQG